MTYEVRLLRRAKKDLDESYNWAANHASRTAALWLIRFERAISTLESHPQRCAIALESKILKREFRELHFGRRPNVFRVVFTIEGSLVRIFRIRRASRRRLTRHDLFDPNEN